MTRFRIFSLLLLLLGASLTVGAGPCTQAQDAAESMAVILDAVWRSEGNSTLLLSSDVRQNVGIAIDLSDEPYPPNGGTDSAFWPRSRIINKVGSTNLEHFELRCGATDEDPALNTSIVFWSSDGWEGSKQSYQCGGIPPESKEIAHDITAAKSFCVVTDETRLKRRDRCLNGPRCDDGQRNGNELAVDCGGSCASCCNDGQKNAGETAVDCGGNCAGCGTGQHCHSNSDCASGSCVSSSCEPPPEPAGTLTMRLRAERANNSDNFDATITWSGNHQGGGEVGSTSFTEEQSYDVRPSLIDDEWHSTMTFYKSGLRPGTWTLSYAVGLSASCTKTLEEGTGKTVNFTHGRSGCTTGYVFP